MLRRGVVVGVHPEGPCVDLVLTDNGARLAGVPVMSMSASSDGGWLDLVKMTEDANKWKINGDKSTVVYGLVAPLAGGAYVCLGFLFPVGSKAVTGNPGEFYHRHQSGTAVRIDELGAYTVESVSGTIVAAGEDGSFSVAQDGGTAVTVADNGDVSAVLTSGPQISLTSTQVVLQFSSSSFITIDASGVSITGAAIALTGVGTLNGSNIVTS